MFFKQKRLKAPKGNALKGTFILAPSSEGKLDIINAKKRVAPVIELFRASRLKPRLSGPHQGKMALQKCSTTLGICCGLTTAHPQASSANDCVPDVLRLTSVGGDAGEFRARQRPAAAEGEAGLSCCLRAQKSAQTFSASLFLTSTNSGTVTWPSRRS